MAEETKDPTRIFPKVLLDRTSDYGTIYVLVSISAVTLVPPEELGEGETPLFKVVQTGAPNFPLGIFGLSRCSRSPISALINMLMASRLVYGMSRERVLPPVLARCILRAARPMSRSVFTTLLAFALITFVGGVPALGGTTALAPALRFTIVNIAVLVLRKDRVGHAHFRTPTILAGDRRHGLRVFAGPWTGRDPIQYRIAGVLVGLAWCCGLLR